MNEDAIYHSNTKPVSPKVKIVDRRYLAFSRLKRKLLRRRWLMRVFLVLAVVVGLFAFGLGTLAVVRRTGANYYLNLASNFLFTPANSIKSVDGRTNILVLGKGGQGHEAPDLTDTLMVVSVKHASPSIDLISVPRDIWIPESRTKLNSAYYWGNQKEGGGGLILAKSSVEEIVGLPISYAAVVDFEIFNDFIEELGGVEVNVERGFVDKRYPIAGKETDGCNGDPEYACRYEMIEFDPGLQYMDGDTALKFVRSRNAEGDEGTDFARSARQQEVMLAIKNRIMQKEILLNPAKLLALKNTFLASVETDLTEVEMAILARRFLQAKGATKTRVLPEDLLDNPPESPLYDNLYVFIPKNGNWDEVHSWVKSVLEN